MTQAAADRSFSKGVQSVAQGDFLSGLVYFESAVQLTEKSGRLQSPPRFQSYYGMCLALASSRVQAGLDLCERAVEVEFFNPDLMHNLARVYLKMGRKARAYALLLQALQLHPQHEGILRDLKSMGIRSRPVIPFLNRGNPINRLLGTALRSSRSRVAR